MRTSDTVKTRTGEISGESKEPKVERKTKLVKVSKEKLKELETRMASQQSYSLNL